jgi:hypothetical protein
MQIVPLTQEEAAGSGQTHKIIVTAADVAALTSGTAASLYPGFNGAVTFDAGLLADNFTWRVKTAFTFSGANNGTLTFQVGDGGDAARFIAADTDLKTAAFGAGAITKYPYVYNAADTIDITVTAAVQAIGLVNAGELHIYCRLSSIAQLDR